MEKNELNQGNASNVIFGTSSDDIEQGLHKGQFIDHTSAANPDDPDMIVNEQEQNEIVNPAEDSFNEGLSPETSGQDKPLTKVTDQDIAEPEEESYDQGSEEESTNTSAKSPTAND